MENSERRVTVVVDTSSGLDEAVSEQYGIVLQDIYVIFSNMEQFRQLQLPFDAFYKKIAELSTTEKEEVPTTSAPSPGDFLKTYKPILENGSDILVLTLTATGSVAYNNACLAADYLSPDQKERVQIKNSETTSAPLAALAMHSAIYGRDHSLQETSNYVDELIPRTKAYATLLPSKNIEKSGRAQDLVEHASQDKRILFGMVNGLPKTIDDNIWSDEELAEKIKEQMLADIMNFNPSGADLVFIYAKNRVTLEAIKPRALEALAEAGIKQGIVHEGWVGAGIGAHGGGTFAGVGVLYHP